MDAIKFLEERARMCGHGCKNCKVYGEQCDIYTEGCNYESLVEAVEEWSAAHPRKTRQSEFLKQWPNADISADGWLEIYPCEVDTTYGGQSCDKNCLDCCRKFWMQEVE